MALRLTLPCGFHKHFDGASPSMPRIEEGHEANGYATARLGAERYCTIAEDGRGSDTTVKEPTCTIGRATYTTCKGG